MQPIGDGRHLIENAIADNPNRAMPPIRWSLVGFALGASVATAAAAQAVPESPDPIKVYLDCRSFCDSDFFRTEIGYLNWVRDRQDADVIILVTSQSTGAGGGAYRLGFTGAKRFASLSDELSYNSPSTASEDELRRGLLQQIKAGLVRYLARTDAGPRLTIGYTPAAATDTARKQRDPWNSWVFTVSGNGFANGESQQAFANFFGAVGANRTTEAWKVEFTVSGSRENNHFTLPDSTIFRSTTSFYDSEFLAVRSLGDHWSAGVTGSLSRSTRSNYKLSTSGYAGLEYNAFKYSESTRHQLTALYEIGVSSYDYEERTIFDKLHETLASERLSVGLVAQQPWGSVNASVTGYHYFDDWSKNRFTLFGGASIRLLKGLSANIFGNYSRVRDQLNIRAEGATEPEVLRQLRELSTSYRYFVSFGLSYRFGSIYNNVVNPRFPGRGGNSRGFSISF